MFSAEINANFDFRKKLSLQISLVAYAPDTYIILCFEFAEILCGYIWQERIEGVLGVLRNKRLCN